MPLAARRAPEGAHRGLMATRLLRELRERGQPRRVQCRARPWTNDRADVAGFAGSTPVATQAGSADQGPARVRDEMAKEMAKLSARGDRQRIDE